MYRRIFFGPGLYSRSVDFSAVGSLDEDYARSWNGKERGKSCSASLSRLRGKIFLSFFLCDQFKNFVRKYIYLGTIDNFSNSFLIILSSYGFGCSSLGTPRTREKGKRTIEIGRCRAVWPISAVSTCARRERVAFLLCWENDRFRNNLAFQFPSIVDRISRGEGEGHLHDSFLPPPLPFFQL